MIAKYDQPMKTIINERKSERFLSIQYIKDSPICKKRKLQNKHSKQQRYQCHVTAKPINGQPTTLTGRKAHLLSFQPALNWNRFGSKHSRSI